MYKMNYNEILDEGKTKTDRTFYTTNNKLETMHIEITNQVCT